MYRRLWYVMLCLLVDSGKAVDYRYSFPWINCHLPQAVDMAQLAGRSLVTPEDPDSNPAIDNFYQDHLFSIYWEQKTKIKKQKQKKRPQGPLFKIRNCNLPFRTLRFKPCGSYVTRRQILLVTIQYNLHLCLALKLK